MNKPTLKSMKWILIASVVVLAFPTYARITHTETGVSGNVKQVRSTMSLDQNWKFIQDDSLTDDAALSSSGMGWQTINLPHTWNSHDAANLHATKPYKRGIGWYRLEFDAPSRGARRWIEIGAASIVADVWLNGVKLGQHKGAFTAFRFDVTDMISAAGNVLLIKTDNRAPVTDRDPTAIMPLAGDFNMSGGLYRHVSLISTPDPVHFDLADMGGPGVYATTTSISTANASMTVRSRLKSDSKDDGQYVVRISLIDAGGRVVQSAQKEVQLTSGSDVEIVQDLHINDAHLWQGLADPYEYQIAADLMRPSGAIIDRVVQNFGIREMRFDPNEGFFLNGKHMALHGVAMHQDFLEKGWAINDRDIDQSMALIREIGANTVRLGHYPFSPYVLDLADRLGLVVWAEAPYGIASTTELLPLTVGVTVPRCPTTQPTDAFLTNAEQQTREMIRQQYNHASVGVWSVGNEVTFMQMHCPGIPYDNVTSVLRRLHAVAKREDPTRATTLADNNEEAVDSSSFIHTGGITDVWATNRYYLWYTGPVSEFSDLLDALHARYPGQPLGISEYGPGAALTHHTDNPLGGPVASGNTGQPVAWQPEEYASYAHEQNYAMMLTKRYLWGTYGWNMFDFATGIRNEGDMRGVNTKGLVTFDRQTRKDPFYFYKANWSSEPVTYIAGRRYTNRAYPFADVKIYSNADTLQLSVNNAPAGSMVQAECRLKTCIFKKVPLRQGPNKLVVVGNHGGKSVTDSVDWSLDANDINIAAGQLETGLTSSTGARFGSDNFFVGGEGGWLIERNTRGVSDKTLPSGTKDAELFSNFRHGVFNYDIPASDGDYVITLGFLEPENKTSVGDRVFDVTANGQTKIANLDVLREAGAYRTAITRTFNASATNGHLTLGFTPIRGEAVVSIIMVRKQ
jgi:beta-galactosidase